MSYNGPVHELQSFYALHDTVIMYFYLLKGEPQDFSATVRVAILIAVGCGHLFSKVEET
jgi:hypothetical protein